MDWETPDAGEPPPAEIRGVQFGLMSTSAILKLSVFDMQQSFTKPKDLTSDRLGLPTRSGHCTTCNASAVDQVFFSSKVKRDKDCQGHFGHILLPTPIFHPSHVGRLVRLLRKICLNCGKPKKSQRNRGKNPSEDDKEKKNEAVDPDESYGCAQNTPDAGGASSNKRKFSTYVNDVMPLIPTSSGTEASEVIVLSSDDEEFSSSGRQVLEAQPLPNDEDMSGGKASCSTPRRRLDRKGKRKHPGDYNETNPTVIPTALDLTDVLVCVKKSKKTKASTSGVEVVDDTFCSSTKDNFTAGDVCLYCSGHSQSSRYPEAQLKLEVKGDAPNLAKSIKLEIRKGDYKNVTPDYWSFVGGSSPSANGKASRSRNLLPSEALKILRKIPEKDLVKLGMHPDSAPAEALVVECLPVPPNCTRLPEDAFGAGGTNVGFKLGIDRGTQAFSKLLSKINSIRSSRFGRPTFGAAVQEAVDLQGLFGQYLREKGAPKAAPGKEKKRTDHVGRVQKKNSRWSLEWLKRNILGKRSGFSARDVVTGDPFLTIEEIGIPLEVAKYLTYPVRVTRLNQNKLQDYVEVGQALGSKTRACGAVRIEQNGKTLVVTPRSSHSLEIGDVVHRHLRDGDLVYVNRPPSLHKHSLIALKTHIQDSATFTINPAVCAPLHADFDGDCLHVFVPQSEESKAELHQLLSVPQQILPPLADKTIVGVSQDIVLGAHLVTSSPLFIEKELMHQLAMWSSWSLPTPTIVKSPKSGPLWTGKQIIDLIIPDEFSSCNSEGTLRIEDGELVTYGEESNWLTSTGGLVAALARRDPAMAVKHLDCSQAVLREWLLSHGFTLNLMDLYAAPDRESRSKMKGQILNDLEQAQKIAVGKRHTFDGKDKGLEAIPDERASGVTKDQNRDLIENVAVSQFLENFTDIGQEITDEIDCKNNLLAMVRSGSKGSVAKVFQQIGSLGLQLHKGEHLLAINGNDKLCSIAETLDYGGRWEARGLIRNSLLDGLDPLEFFVHAVAVRAALLRQSFEVAEPGELFKRLMLCLRDVHVSYDGTVRNKSGLEIIQFHYGGGNLEEESNEGKEGKCNESVMPGEAVGILAATAIAQPAYQVMLEATHSVGSRKIRPLELLQETMFPRSTSGLKESDRRSILRLEKCDCGKLYCDERRILDIRSALQPVAVQDFALSKAIEYVPDDSEHWDAFSVNRQTQKLRMPWVGHILLDQTAMIERGLHEDQLLDILKRRVETHNKTLGKFQLGAPLFTVRYECCCMGLRLSPKQKRLCLHFSPMPKANPKRTRVKVSRNSTEDTIDMLQNFLLPFVLQLTVKGDERIDSTKILWEDMGSSQAGREVDCSEAAATGELTLEVTVKEAFSRGRGTPWKITKEACIPVGELIDWRRSSPYSVQEMRCALGIEAARDCILQRFNLATQATGTSMGAQHLELVTDLMVHSGEVHGLTSHGYRDFMRSLKTKAPLTAGAFRAPVKSFMEAGERGEEEVLRGVLASCVFGKRVPVGTGADFGLKLNSISESSCGSACMSESVDVYEYLGELKGKIGVEKLETPPQSEVRWGSTAAHGSWPESSPVETGAWGAGPESDQNAGSWGGGGWGSPKPATDKTNGSGWGDGGWSSSPRRPDKTQDGGSWGSPRGADKTSSGWGDGGWGGSPKSADKVHDGWGSPEAPDKARDGAWEDGGWGSSKGPEKTSGGAWEDGPDKTTGGASQQADGWSSPKSPNKAQDGLLENNGSGSSKGADGSWASPSKTATNAGAGSRGSPKQTDKTNQGGWDSFASTSEPVKEKKPSQWNDGDSAWGSSPKTTTLNGGNWESGDAARDGARVWSPNKTVSNGEDLGTEVASPAGNEAGGWETGGQTKASGGCEAEDTAPAETSGLDHVGNGAGGWETGSQTKSTSNAGHSSWEGEAEAGKSTHWEKAGTDPAGAWADGKDAQCSSPGGRSTKQKPVFGEESDGMRKKEPRPFKPTGANSMPLGKVRVFKNAVQQLPVLESVSASNSFAVFSPHDGSPQTQPKKAANSKQPENGREVDSRRESEEWKELENLVGSIRNIFKKYELEARIVDEDESIILEQILPNHPNSEAKVGCGIDYIKIADHMDTRCLFLVRKDGTTEEFSYHKCLLTLASKKDPSLEDLYKSQYMSRKRIEVELERSQTETISCGAVTSFTSFVDSNAGPLWDSSA